MKVRDIMSRPVVHAHAEMPVADLAELLAQKRISAVPITDDGGAVIGAMGASGGTGQQDEDVVRAAIG